MINASTIISRSTDGKTKTNVKMKSTQPQSVSTFSLFLVFELMLTYVALINNKMDAFDPFVLALLHGAITRLFCLYAFFFL